MVKLIFMDLDETLFGADRTVSAYTQSVLRRARARGVHLFCATARGVMAQRLIPWELYSGGVFASGAVVEVGGRRVYDRTIPPETAARVLHGLDAMGVRAGAEVEWLHYANFTLCDLWSEFEQSDQSEFSRLPGGAGKIYALLDTPEQEQVLAADLPPELYYRINRDNLTLVMHREADKGLGARAAAEAMGIDLADTAAFGDDVTDIGMLKMCGIGVAMGNALDDVKAAADLVCGSNSEDGVARLIERWLDEDEVGV